MIHPSGYGSLLGSEDLFKQGDTATVYVVFRSTEVAGVPGICYITAISGVIHKEGDLSLRVSTELAEHGAEIVLIHAHDIIKTVVVIVGQATGGLTFGGDATLCKELSHRGIDGVSQLVGTGGGGFDVEFMG